MRYLFLRSTRQSKKILPSRLLLSNGRFIYLDPAGCGVPLILTKINTTAASPWDDSGRWLMIIVVAQRTEVSVRPFLREHHPELSGSQPEGIQFRVNCSSLPHPPQTEAYSSSRLPSRQVKDSFNLKKSPLSHTTPRISPSRIHRQMQKKKGLLQKHCSSIHFSAL